jgi:pantoate--beta-alanine ligase
MQKDLEFLSSLGVDVVWLPTAESMYPSGFQTWISVEEVSAPLEGKCRPGHFRGVATIVAKLFNCLMPDKAYFGQKDAQQIAVIKRMIRDLDFPVELVVCPTVREPDGLALQPQRLLNQAERQAATILYQLCAAEINYRGTDPALQSCQ